MKRRVVKARISFNFDSVHLGHMIQNSFPPLFVLSIICDHLLEHNINCNSPRVVPGYNAYLPCLRLDNPGLTFTECLVPKLDFRSGSAVTMVR